SSSKSWEPASQARLASCAGSMSRRPWGSYLLRSRKALLARGRACSKSFGSKVTANHPTHTDGLRTVDSGTLAFVSAGRVSFLHDVLRPWGRWEKGMTRCSGRLSRTGSDVLSSVTLAVCRCSWRVTCREEQCCGHDPLRYKSTRKGGTMAGGERSQGATARC